MAEYENQQESISAQTAQDAVNTIQSLASVARAAGKAATGNVESAAKDILTDDNAWKALLCILLSGTILFISAFAMLGVMIIGVADKNMGRTWGGIYMIHQVIEDNTTELNQKMPYC